MPMVKKKSYGHKHKRGSKGKYYSSHQSSMQNAAKTLFANIRFMSPDKPIVSLVMTSSVPNEGKTTCSIELCRTMASAGKKVLLVEADGRRRSVGGELGMHPRYGVYSVISGEVDLEDAVIETDDANMYFLDCEPHIPNPADIYSSKRYARLVEHLSTLYDYVVFDTPPVGTFIDAAILSTLVDGVVLVARVGYVRREDMLDASEQLRKAGANLLGVCANFCEESGSGYYYYKYYHYDPQAEEPDTGKGSDSSLAKLEEEMRASSARGETAARSSRTLRTQAVAPQGEAAADEPAREVRRGNHTASVPAWNAADADDEAEKAQVGSVVSASTTGKLRVAPSGAKPAGGATRSVGSSTALPQTNRAEKRAQQQGGGRLHDEAVRNAKRALRNDAER